jgi:hypothetical protein
MNVCQAKKIVSANITFVSPSGGDDKNWETKLDVSIYLSDGTLVGSSNNNNCTSASSEDEIKRCFCCVQNTSTTLGTKFIDNSTPRGPFPITISKNVTENEIKTGYFEVTMTAAKDRWVFIPEVTLIFDDGSTRRLSGYGWHVIQQDSPTTTLVFH